MALIEFKHKAFVGKACIVDEDFVAMLTKFADAGVLYGFTFSINNSFANPEDKLTGKVVERVSKSNHFIGHAIDTNIIDRTGKVWTHDMLEFASKEIIDFIGQVKKYGFRWGGDFQKKDRIHFDDGLNLKNPELWKQKYLQFQK